MHALLRLSSSSTSSASAASSSSSPPPLLLEATVSATAASSSGVVPGARCAPLSAIDVSLFDAKTGQPKRVSGNFSLRPADELLRELEALGIQHRRHTIVYTQATKNGNPDLAVAARLVWALSFAGVRHVSLFSGGLSAWCAAGFDVATSFEPPPPAPLPFYEEEEKEGERSLPFPLHPEFCATTPDVEAAVATSSSSSKPDDCSVRLADVRSWREYSGGQHDYPYHLPLGRIPHARWAHWGPSTYVGGDFFVRETGVLHQLAQTETLWKDWGIHLNRPGEKLIFYCGSGWRSAVAWCLARLLGHENCCSYDGGFLEWSVLDERADAHPIDRGEQHASSSSGGSSSAVGAEPDGVRTAACGKRRRGTAERA